MSLHKLPRGLLEIPQGTHTSCNENSAFMNSLERTNSLLAQFVSSTDSTKKLMMRQELEESYFNLTMYNLKESVKHKIEQDMWNNLFKKYISDMQIKIKSKDKMESSRAQSEMSIFLDEAVGFYSKCIDTMSLLYNIYLPGGHHSVTMSSNKSRSPTDRKVSEEDIRYIIQHCYLHMGDLYRYQNLSKQAQFYYELAVELNPTSGHAYNQLAILESSSVIHSGISTSNYHHIIRTILMYEYANSCEIPFPATRINMESLLRHVNEQSVSMLLTSNNSVSDQNCLHTIVITWIHVYGNLRMCHNLQRCRQLQQRIIDSASELFKYIEICKKNWRDLVSMTALHCSLFSNYISQSEFIENKVWSTNMQQFSQEFINAISRGFVSVSHDTKLLEELLSNSGCISIIVIFLLWINQYLDMAQSPFKSPFKDDFVKFLNILLSKSTHDYNVHVKHIQLPELGFLMGFQPLKLPYRIYDIYSCEKIIEKTIDLYKDQLEIRMSFIVSVCRKIASNWNSLLIFNDSEKKFHPAPSPDSQSMKKYLKIETSITAKKSVNVALASMQNNNTKSNGPAGQYIPSRVPDSDLLMSESTKGVITDVKIAKCIQDHIAKDAKPVANSVTVTETEGNKNVRDENHIIAPAPGLILSSSLPPEYKSTKISSGTDYVSTSSSKPTGDETLITTNDQSDHKPNQTSNKNHSSYNPNRIQFEKDLPPRFAAKRTFSQEAAMTAMEPNRNYFDQNKGGFMSMNYWDSINENQLNHFDNNLAKKESEILLPPTVPMSWLTEDAQDHHLIGAGNGCVKMETGPKTNSPSLSPFPFGGNSLMHSQPPSKHSYSAIPTQSTQAHLNVIHQAFNQFNQTPPTNTEPENSQLQYLLNSVPSQSNTPRFRAQTDALLTGQMNNLDNQMNSFIQQAANANARISQQKFSSIPQPNQQSMGLHLPTTPQQNVINQNYDTFQLTRPNFFDKPVFSTSNNHSSGFGYSSGSIMAPPHQQHQGQQPQHQVRHNNPLLNLLPGYMNEGQR